MKVRVPGRILDRHVGGNTTYVRNLADGLRKSGIAVDSMPMASHPVTTLGLESLEGLKRRSEGTLLHYVADTGPLIATRTPSVVTVHGIASAHLSGVRSPLQERVWRARVRRAIHSTDRVITVSESSAGDISDIFGIDQEDITVIPHGIDASAFRQNTEVSETTMGKIPSQFLLYVGNIEPRKNLIELVKAVSTPEVRGFGLPLVIAGKPAWRAQESMEMISSSPNVIYLGFVSDQDRVALMQRCAAFVFPSRYEGFGFPVLEAMAAGATVLTSNRGSLGEVAGPAIILESINAEGIADGLQKLLLSGVTPQSKKSGYEWADSFSWASSVQAHIKTYREVLNT